MKLPRVTAIVVVHGSPADVVAECIESLLASRDVDLRIVLVDNASPDGGAACAPWASVDRVEVVTAASNRGFAAGVNLGLEHRRPGDLVLLLNDDATVAPDAIARCAQMLSASPPHTIAIAPRVMLRDAPDRIDSIGVVVRPNGEAFNAHIGAPWNGQVDDGEEVLGPCFGAALFRADAFELVGPISERYRLYYEDIDWDLRARRLGFRTQAAVDAVVHHRHAASTRTLGEATRYELVQRNLLLCVTANFSAQRAAAAWASRLVVHAKGVITGPYRMGRVRAVGRALLGVPGTLAARRRRGEQAPGFDEARLFAFAAGMSPNFSADTYQPLD